MWHTHPSGCKVLGRITDLIMEEEDLKEENEKSDKKDPKFRLEILVDEQWTSREIAVLCSLIGEFRINLNRISLDAPIFELVSIKSVNQILFEITYLIKSSFFLFKNFFIKNENSILLKN